MVIFLIRLGRELLAWQETAHAGPQGSSECSYADDIGAKCLVLVFDHVKNHSSAVLCRNAGSAPENRPYVI